MIRRRVYQDNGEDAESAVVRCPGESCERWAGASGSTYEEKSLACADCGTCRGNPPAESLEIPEDPECDPEIEDLVDEIAYIIAWENAGIATDWSAYTFEHQKLTVIWRETEQEIKRIHSMRLQAYLKAQFAVSP